MRPRLLTALIVLGALVSSSAASASTVGVAGESTIVFSLDAMTGRQQWQTAIDGSGWPLVLFADDRTVFVQVLRCLSGDRAYRTGDSALVALDARTGEMRWQVRDVGAPAWNGTKPSRLGVVVLDLLAKYPSGIIPVFSSKRGELWGLDPESGKERWRVEAAGLAPIGGNANVVVLANRPALPFRQLLAVDRSTGSTRWEVAVEDRAEVLGAAATGSRLAIASGRYAEHLDIFDISNGVRLASAPLNGSTFQRVRAVASTVAVATTESVQTFDARSGRENWAESGVYLLALARAAGRTVVVTVPSLMNDQRGELARDGTSGDVLWQDFDHANVFATRGSDALVFSDPIGFSVVDTATHRLRWERRLDEFGEADYLHAPAIALGRGSVYVTRGCEPTARD